MRLHQEPLSTHWIPQSGRHRSNGRVGLQSIPLGTRRDASVVIFALAGQTLGGVSWRLRPPYSNRNYLKDVTRPERIRSDGMMSAQLQNRTRFGGNALPLGADWCPARGS